MNYKTSSNMVNPDDKCKECGGTPNLVFTENGKREVFCIECSEKMSKESARNELCKIRLRTLEDFRHYCNEPKILPDLQAVAVLLHLLEQIVFGILRHKGDTEHRTI